MEKNTPYIMKLMESPGCLVLFGVMVSANLSFLFLFGIGIHFEYQFLQRLKYRDIIRPTELVVDSYTNLRINSPTYIVEGYIDSVSVSLSVQRSDLRDSVSLSLAARMSGESIAKGARWKKIPVWYNPVNADIFHRRPKDNGAKFSIAIWSWYYFKCSLFLLPQLFLIRFMYKNYKNYKEYKKK